MKKQFAEYYELPEERIKEIWENSLIVFDTNVLLNLYRYNEDTRIEFINIIKFYKERLWIPYQVGLEFHRRREDILRKNAAAYKALSDKLSEQLVKVVDTLGSNGDFARHPYIDIKDIRKRVERCVASIAKSLEKQGQAHPNYTQKDYVLDAVTNLFDGRVGADFSEEELDKLYLEGEKRYSKQVPPGYCDEKNKKDKPQRSLYGDLIVWMQVISHIKSEQRNVIFVTDDHKPDWWDKVDGKHSPRKELIKEFMDCTGQNILIYDSSRFLEYAKKNKELKVSQKTINEVGKVRDIDFSIMDFMNMFRRLGESHLFNTDKLSRFDFPMSAPYDSFDNYIRSIGEVQSRYDLSNWRRLSQIDPMRILTSEYVQEPDYLRWRNLGDTASVIDPQTSWTHTPRNEDKKEQL